MEKDFEQSMRDKMDEASLGDLIPQFDKDEEWSQLSAKLHPQRRRVIPIMWSHAAAILIGITIGWLFLRNTGRNMPAEHSVATVVTPAPVAAPSPVVVHDTVIMEHVAVKEVKARPAVATVSSEKVQMVHDTVKVYVSNTANAIPAANELPEAPAVTPTVAVASVKTQRPRAVHLLDVDNEDKKLIINPGYQQISNGVLNKIQHVLFSQSAVVVSEDKSDEKPYSARHLVK